MKLEPLGLKLIYLRKKKGYTQHKVAEILHISRSSLSRYEKNIRIPNTEILIQLAELYDVSCDYLLCRDI